MRPARYFFVIQLSNSRGNFEIVLDDQGNILELNQNWIV